MELLILASIFGVSTDSLYPTSIRKLKRKRQK
jgi:hypothetical protein